MIEIDIPGYKRLRLRYLVLDYNGTLALEVAFSLEWPTRWDDCTGRSRSTS